MGSNCIAVWLDLASEMNWDKGHQYIDSDAVEDLLGTISNRPYLHNALKALEEAIVSEYHPDMDYIELPPYQLWLAIVSKSDLELPLLVQQVENLQRAQVLDAVGFYQNPPDYESMMLGCISRPALRPLLIGINEDLDTLLDKEGKEVHTPTQ